MKRSDSAGAVLPSGASSPSVGSLIQTVTSMPNSPQQSSVGRSKKGTTNNTNSNNGNGNQEEKKGGKRFL